MINGKKYQKMSGKKPMMLLLSIVVVLMIWGLLSIVGKRNFTNEYNVFDKLEELPGFLVNESEELNPTNDMSFNLKRKSYFGHLKVVENGKNGYGLLSDQNPMEVYNQRLQGQIGIFKKLKTSHKELKDNDYILERDILPLLDEKEFSKRFAADFENMYLKHGLKKVRITFNKKNVPLKVDGYYEDENGTHWEFLRHITYPYKTEIAFNWELKEYIDLINIVEQEEWEGDE